IPIKDSVNTKDYPTTGGTPALRYFRPESDAPLVHALRSAGAVVMCKTNLHELSFGWTSNNLAFGAVHNPYDPTRVPGGSTGGTAGAVAPFMGPLGGGGGTQRYTWGAPATCGKAGVPPHPRSSTTQGCVPPSAPFHTA